MPTRNHLKSQYRHSLFIACAVVVALGGCDGFMGREPTKTDEPSTGNTPGSQETPTTPSTPSIPLNPVEPTGTQPSPNPSPRPLVEGVCINPGQISERGFLSPQFQMQCAGCHGAFGEGTSEFPTLPGDASTLDAFRRYVRDGKVKNKSQVMPAFHSARYSDAALADDFQKLSSTPAGQRSARATERPSFQFAVAQTANADAVFRKGLEAWRKPGLKGACASCHGPMGVDLARIRFSDADIMRRCFGQEMQQDECFAIVDMVHTVRGRFNMQHFCEKNEGFLQPGHGVLSGNTPHEKDLSLVQEFDRIGLPLFTQEVATRQQFDDIIKRFQEIKPHSIKIGLKLNKWTEDKFFGDQSLSSREWIPDYPAEPTDAIRQQWYALHDAYIANPTGDNMWRINELVSSTRPAPAYRGPDLNEMYEEMKRSPLSPDEFIRLKNEQHRPLAAYQRGSLEHNFTNYNRTKYKAVLLAQHMMVDNVVALPRPPSYRSRGELSNPYGGVNYGGSSIWDVGDGIISGCVSGCWDPSYFKADLSPSVAATTRFGLTDDSVYEDFARTASLWPYLATTLDYGEQQLRITNEYYYGNFGSANHVGTGMYLHQLWVRAVVTLGDLFLLDTTIPQRRGDRDYRSTFVAFDGVNQWLKGQVWSNMGGAQGGHPQTDAYAKKFSQNLLRMSFWAAEDLCTGRNTRLTNMQCPIGEGEGAGRALNACEVASRNTDGFDFSKVASACQVIQRCTASCNPRR
jgi:mono/diheme cytochrome c family protein